MGKGPDLGDPATAEAGPDVALRVEDDRARVYAAELRAGDGEGQGRQWQWRATYTCYPALDPAAHGLWLTIATLSWPRDGAATAEGMRRRVQGPWIFSVPLAADMHEGR